MSKIEHLFGNVIHRYTSLHLY